MSSYLRQQKVTEAGEPVTQRYAPSATPGVLRRPLWLLTIFGYTLLLLTPFFFGQRPVAEYLGMTAPADKYSRISFQLQVPDIEAIEHNVEKTHYPIYEEVPRGIWMSRVFNPVAGLLEKAADLRNPEALVKYATGEKITLTADEAKVLTDYMLKELEGGLYAQMVSPARRALDQWICSRGVINQDRYREEMKRDDHSIEIVEPGNRLVRGRIEEVGRDSGPAGMDEVPALLDKAFYDKLWLVRDSVRRTIAAILARRIENNPTLVYEQELTASTLKYRKEEAQRRASHIGIDELMLQKGEKVTSAILAKLRAENEAYLRSLGPLRLAGELAGKGILVFALLLAYVRLMQRHGHFKQMRTTALLALPITVLLYLLVLSGSSLALLPLGFLIGCAALGAGVEAGILTAGTFCAVAFCACAFQPGVLLAYFLGGCVFCTVCVRQRFRMGLAKAAILSGLVGALVFLCWQMSWGAEPELPSGLFDFFTLQGGANLLVQAVWIIASWLASFLLLLPMLPLLQPLYGTTSNLQLQDLQEHPLLNRLLLEAPSTYYHSSVVSALAEAAAHSVGANGLLCKTACLYHDLGKLIKPEYFTENESGISRHDALTPNMSALIIISHVKDGVEMARQWHLPQAIVDIVAQHHGTTMVGFFYRQACEQAADPEEVDDSLFRYPGPRPQFREAAICMIADSVEAASRSLDGASPARIRSLVHGIIIGKLEDRQFDECGLTFTDLARIEESLVRILASMFHSRVKYDKPSAQPRRRAAAGV